MLGRLSRHIPGRIGTRLYCVAGLALLIVAALALAAVRFATLAEETGAHIRDLLQVEIGHVTELEVLLERHRRIVESAPVQIDRRHIAGLRRASDEIAASMRGQAPPTHTAFHAFFAVSLPLLTSQAQRVLHLADNFAQSAAIDEVTNYVTTADGLHDALVTYKTQQMRAIQHEVEQLRRSGANLTRSALVGAAVALILIGPFSLMVTRGIVIRLQRMTGTMLKLASNDTAVRVSGTKYDDEIGDMARALEVFKANAVAVLAHQDEIETLNARFEFALENMSRGLSMFDSNHRLIVCNAHYREMYALTPALTQPGTTFASILAHRIRVGTGRLGESVGGVRLNWPMDDPATAQGAAGLQSLTHDLADGRVMQIAYQPLSGGGWVALHEDVTEERAQDVRIERLAREDALTGLANRHAFTEELTRALAHLGAGGGLAIHWLDLDRFKEVNDTLGHPVGDALLGQVAERLSQSVRTGDFVARLGGDEFAVIQARVAMPAEAEPLAQRIVRTLSAPFDINGHRIHIGASVGIVLSPAHGRAADELLRNADIALYQAKAAGRGRCQLFTAELEQAVVTRRQLEVELEQAIRDGAFHLAYQPILDLRTGQTAVCEALLRWTHSERGNIPPSQFIALAEEISLIKPLGTLALRRACADAAAWAGNVKVAVNVSAVQLRDGDFVCGVKQALADAGLAPDRLELEITETALLSDDVVTLDSLHALRALGISIALDDFGTGYSSLGYLRRFPFDKIKIDQTFIRDLPARTEAVAIVRAITDLAKTLGMTTVAEGVETEDHLQRVMEAGCDLAQGYLLGRPGPAALIPPGRTLPDRAPLVAAA
jgi:diguanylate cyclase (GGDEF)-like protein